MRAGITCRTSGELGSTSVRVPSPAGVIGTEGSPGIPPNIPPIPAGSWGHGVTRGPLRRSPSRIRPADERDTSRNGGYRQVAFPQVSGSLDSPTCPHRSPSQGEDTGSNPVGTTRLTRRNASGAPPTSRPIPATSLSAARSRHSRSSTLAPQTPILGVRAHPPCRRSHLR